MRAPDYLLACTVLAGLVGCGDETPTSASAARAASTPLYASAAGFASWMPALNIEVATPGADPNFNTALVEGCPFVSRDGKAFFMASNRVGGHGGLDIWLSTRESVDDPWGEPRNVEAVNSTANDFCPTLARDGHTFYFVSNRLNGCGGGDIYTTRIGEDWAFEAPRNLGCTVNSAADEAGPFPLPERGSGPVLYFSSTRPGLGVGGDIYMSESHGGEFAAATRVPGVNSALDDGQPNVRRDGLELFFYSRRQDLPGAMGGADLYASTRASLSDSWSTPVNLGEYVNSAADDTRPSLSWDGTTLYFGSGRLGGDGLNDIYVTTRQRLTGSP